MPGWRHLHPTGTPVRIGRAPIACDPVCQNRLVHFGGIARTGLREGRRPDIGQHCIDFPLVAQEVEEGLIRLPEPGQIGGAGMQHRLNDRPAGVQGFHHRKRGYLRNFCIGHGEQGGEGLAQVIHVSAPARDCRPLRLERRVHASARGVQFGGPSAPQRPGLGPAGEA